MVLLAALFSGQQGLRTQATLGPKLFAPPCPSPKHGRGGDCRFCRCEASTQGVPHAAAWPRQADVCGEGQVNGLQPHLPLPTMHGDVEGALTQRALHSQHPRENKTAGELSRTACVEQSDTGRCSAAAKALGANAPVAHTCACAAGAPSHPTPPRSHRDIIASTATQYSYSESHMQRICKPCASTHWHEPQALVPFARTAR
jgi:hypothetical protein